MTRRTVAVPIAASLLMGACAAVPTGPSMMVLPGSGKSFEQFIGDDAACRQWAAQPAGTTPKTAATDSTTGGAASGTGGTAAGSSYGQAAGMSAQQQYDIAYMQCMYARGHQIPVASGYTAPPPEAPAPRPPGVPPPPEGSPPPPPPR